MDTINCMKTRRSRRLFLDKEVSDEKINQILECGTTAPSSVDCQPWHFVIVKDKDKLKKIAELKNEDNQKHILTAPLSIVVFVDTESSPSRFIEDGVTATQNILLAAHNLNLGAVYITGGKPEEPAVSLKVRDILSVPEKFMPISIIPIGYSDPNEKLEEKTLVDLNKITHKDSW